jgi:hypothetical protein
MTHDCNPLDLLDDCGCDQCNADVTLTPDPIHVDIYWLRIRHTAGCPFLARVRAARWN